MSELIKTKMDADRQKLYEKNVILFNILFQIQDKRYILRRKSMAVTDAQRVSQRQKNFNSQYKDRRRQRLKRKRPSVADYDLK